MTTAQYDGHESLVEHIGDPRRQACLRRFKVAVGAGHITIIPENPQVMRGQTGEHSTRGHRATRCTHPSLVSRYTCIAGEADQSGVAGRHALVRCAHDLEQPSHITGFRTVVPSAPY